MTDHFQYPGQATSPWYCSHDGLCCHQTQVVESGSILKWPDVFCECMQEYQHVWGSFRNSAVLPWSALYQQVTENWKKNWKEERGWLIWNVSGFQSTCWSPTTTHFSERLKLWQVSHGSDDEISCGYKLFPPGMVGTIDQTCNILNVAEDAYHAASSLCDGEAAVQAKNTFSDQLCKSVKRDEWQKAGQVSQGPPSA